MRVLLIESNPADAYLTVEALKQAGLSEGVMVQEDSLVALEQMRKDNDAPDLILLDLNVAPISGLDFLAEVRGDARLGNVPVVIISGSENRDDVRKAYALRANCYINKPAHLEEFLRVMKTCYEFWGTVATLPPK
jgi:two-component system, chemotaxis family, response regulator Rcp1